MTRETFERLLAQLGTKPDTAITALVTRYQEDLAEHLAAAVRYAAAGTLHTQLEETAARPLRRALGSKHGPPDAWILFELTNAVAAAESAVLARLRRALRDLRRVDVPPEMAAIEEQDPPFRVCDEAYLALRRIARPEPVLQFSLESRHFLGLPDAEKDLEIERCLKSQSFTRFLPDVDEEEG